VKAPGTAGREIAPADIKSADFATTVSGLLLNRERGEQELAKLLGAMRLQVARAGVRYDGHHVEAGNEALTGAFFLMRTGELSPGALRGLDGPLLDGADEAARVGNAGRARALYRDLEHILPEGPRRKDVVDHLAALEAWSKPTTSESRLETAGRLQRASVQEALIDVRPETLATARDHITAWVHAALQSDIAERPITTPDERDEALEAYRAVRTGGVVLVGLYLRHGDPLGALRAIDEADLSRIVPPALRDRLQRAGEDDDARAWLDLFRLYDSDAASESPETALDHELSRGAAFGAALGLYRSSPGDAQASMPLSMLLVELGMPEVASSILAQNVDRTAGVEATSFALTLVMRAIVQEEEVGDIEGARRTFENAKPLLQLAEDPRLAQVTPRPGRIQYVMGALEAKNGALDRALPLFQASVKTTPTVPALESIAAIERQSGQLDQALRSLGAAITLARASGDILSEAECEELIFQIERDRGKNDAASSALARALERVLTARKLDSVPENLARSERLLARVLENYREPLAARKASERALEASRSNTRQIAATLTDMARRALVLGDLRAARQATQEAMRAELPPEDLVYIVLWQRLLEEQLGARDGLTEEAFSSLSEQTGWVAALRDWGRGRIGDADLQRAAQDEVERTEAAFYGAMATRVSGQPGGGADGLRRVAQSRTIDLVEVSIARDLTAPQLKPALPAGVQLP
jgi:tetratricopeptide (TPR) repeat protein